MHKAAQVGPVKRCRHVQRLPAVQAPLATARCALRERRQLCRAWCSAEPSQQSDVDVWGASCECVGCVECGGVLLGVCVLVQAAAARAAVFIALGVARARVAQQQR